MLEHDFVVHFAAESHVDRSIKDPSDFIRTNVMGTYNVLESSLRNKVKTVINVSTDEVYGSLPYGSADETYPLKPNSPYAASKSAADLLARSFFITYGLDVRTTRCCNNYGKSQFPEKVIPVFIRKLLNQEKLPIYGDGENVREWIHVSDHSSGIQKVLEAGQAGEIYNIGSGIHLTNNQLASEILNAMNLDEGMKNYVEDRLGHDFRYSVNSSKIENLGFKQKINFTHGLKETIDWYLVNQNWWESQEEFH